MPAARLRPAAAGLLVLYGIVVARLTLFPADTESGTFTALDDLVRRLTGGGLDWAQLEVLANVALFVPAGFLLSVAFARCWAGVLCCVFASAAIEGAQLAFLPSRVPSWADVEHNGLGAVIGALLAWPLVSWLRRRTSARAAESPRVLTRAR